MLSDNEKTKHYRVPRRSVNAKTNKHWSDSQKIEAVTTYLALGNLVLTAQVLKIPEMTLRMWKAKDWWKQVEDDLRVQEDLQLSTRLKGILENTLAATEDRIKHGDWFYNNKEGCLQRKPVAMKDLHKVTMDIVDKREHLSGKNPATVAIEAVDARLQKLAEQFEKIANRRTVEVTDVIIGNEMIDGEYTTTESV